MALNGLNDRIELVCGTLDGAARTLNVHIVLANLDRQTLLLLADDLAGYASAGARLMVSGVLLDQQADIIGRFTDLGLACSRRRECEWAALEFIVPESCDGAEA